MKSFHCHADVLGDLAQQRRRNVSALVEGNRCEASAGVFELLVRSALPHHFEPKSSKDLDHFNGLENWCRSHDQARTEIC